MYEKLYEHSRIKIENTLRPIKEWYFQDPDGFDIYDPNLIEKALLFSERQRDKNERFRINNHRDIKMKKLFQKIYQQK